MFVFKLANCCIKIKLMGLTNKRILKRKLVRHRHAGGKIAGFRTVEPLKYYRRFLKENSHPDGRELGELRTTNVNIKVQLVLQMVLLQWSWKILQKLAVFAALPTDVPDKGMLFLMWIYHLCIRDFNVDLFKSKVIQMV